MAHQQIIEADWTWTGARFERDVQVVVSPGGVIERVGAFSERPTLRLAHQALLPGFINVHSHAFQRGLRGRGETFPQGAGSFWTWREAMYALVDSMTSERLYELTCQAFSEMLACGITTVGEFHYVHHDASGKGFTLDDAILQAAHDVGIRLVLLQTYYRTGGVNQPLTGGQLRFACHSTDEYWKQFDRLAAHLRSDRQTMGAVAHSIRAASIDEIAELHGTARRRGLLFHVHVEEQQKEIDDCVAAYGQRPMALFLDRLAIDETFTAIHCTHTAADELRRFLAAGGNVGLCPISEANLGDGIADIPTMHAHPGQVCIGTDANTRASMTDELRWVEYAQRLKHQRRGVCRDDEGQVGRSLFEQATVNGARSLGLCAGAIEPGRHADLFTLDLHAPSLTGWTPESLVDAFIFGAADGVVCSTCVGGRWTSHHPIAR
jgi:formimidoylglutamate deiminase